MYEPNLINLTTRQICAIESAAIHNPKSNIFLVYSNRRYRNKYVREPLLDTLLFYKNVYIRNVNLWSFVNDTPMEKWFKTGKLFESHFITIHLSDFLRLLLLWRYGGTYLDLDTITLKSLESMPHNYAGIQSKDIINQAVLKISSNGDGHKLAEQFLLDYQQKFSAIYWAHNGPSLITRVLKRTCCTDDILKMINNPKCCKDFNVYPRNAFYEINFEELDFFFDEALLDQMLNRTQNSIVLHLWNKFSQHRKMKVGSNVAYDLAAQIHCPRTYAKAGEYF
ncbi:lactosylceramide 4-alpha-galactosyltransferase-like [Teleopsis dalmanni]|uniref:lactosylceramide 4-alpha-galactosyltransferase-like n=1 Tax=Teleopsis dalmanni TaxID=139649 RepID=UPI0018CF021F|nr:lactosylceramide 4-alpha-galactosyltransferase-like [Teleopsis dalmanni]